MTDRQHNLAFVEAAVDWVVLRLRRRASQVASEMLTPLSPAEQAALGPGTIAINPPRRRLAWFGGDRGEERALSTPVRRTSGAQIDPAKSKKDDLNAQVEQARRKMDDLAAKPRPRLLRLARRLGLTRFEWETLLLCVAVELRGETGSLCARIQGHPDHRYPTFSLASSVFDTPEWDAVLPHRPLRYFRLIEINQPGAESLTTSPLRADEHVVAFVKGLGRSTLDPMLQSLVRPCPPGWALLPPSVRSVAERAVKQWSGFDKKSKDPMPAIQLTGPDPAGKLAVAAEVCAALKPRLKLYRLSSELIPVGGDIDLIARLWERDSLLKRLALYIEGHDWDAGPSGGEVAAATQPANAIGRFLAACGPRSAVFLSVRDPWPRMIRPAVTFHVSRPTRGEQRDIWRTRLRAAFAPLTGDEFDDPGVPVGAAFFPPVDDETSDYPAPPSGLWTNLASVLSGQFDMAVADIGQAVDAAVEAFTHRFPGAYSNPPESIDRAVFLRWLRDELWSACRTVLEPRMNHLAQRLTSNATWHDLVLPKALRRTLHQIVRQVNHRGVVENDWGMASKSARGNGVAVLFAGESGAGKTLAAEVLANALKLDLYRIDLSAVVSKYIGETEKNLARLFDAAEGGGAVLFFDEADALFGKRSEVKDSHDRYANIEVNYLLQRMEQFRGLAILASNRKSALDAAFSRRLRFILDFPVPVPADRKRMWQRVFPRRMPKPDLDYDRLATLPLSGGSIRNIAVNAAYVAARRERPLTTDVVLACAREEFVKQGRLINEQDFSWQPKKTEASSKPKSTSPSAGAPARSERFDRMVTRLMGKPLLLNNPLAAFEAASTPAQVCLSTRPSQSEEADE